LKDIQLKNDPGHAQFINLHGQPGARLSCLQSLHKDVKIKSSLLINILAPFFSFKSIYPKIPGMIWTDNMIIETAKKMLAETSQSEQQKYLIPVCHCKCTGR
jgi:hypothetical protein